MIPKDTKEQSTDRHNGRCSGTQEIPAGPKQVSATLSHWYPTIQLQHKTPYPRVQATQKVNPDRPPRVASIVVLLVAQE